MLYELDVIGSSEELLALAPADLERRVAGALRRREITEDYVTRLFLGVVGPYLQNPIQPSDLLSRNLGESLIPGYRKEDHLRA